MSSEASSVFDEVGLIMMQFYCDYRRGKGRCTGACWQEPDCAQGSPTDEELLGELRAVVSPDDVDPAAGSPVVSGRDR